MKYSIYESLTIFKLCNREAKKHSYQTVKGKDLKKKKKKKNERYKPEKLKITFISCS